MMNNDKHHFKIDSKGLFSYYTNITPLTSEDLGDMNSYCMEFAEALNMKGYFIFHCHGDSNPEEKFQYTFYAFILSCIFLVLTTIVYIVLNEVKKIFGKILVLYCIAMLLESGTLAFATWDRVPSNTDCQIIGEKYKTIIKALGRVWKSILETCIGIFIFRYPIFDQILLFCFSVFNNIVWVCCIQLVEHLVLGHLVYIWVRNNNDYIRFLLIINISDTIEKYM